MAKYIDSDEQVDIDRVKERFLDNFEGVLDEAKAKSDDLLSEIKHFRESSFSELVGELETEFNKKRDKAKKDSKYPLLVEQRVRGAIYDRIEHNYPSSSESDELMHAVTEEFNKLSEEEKLDIYFEDVDRQLAEAFEIRKEALRKTDVLYDMLTEDQIMELVNLYYLSILKGKLVYKKERAMMDAARDLGKETKFMPWIRDFSGEKVGFTDKIGTIEKHAARVVEEKPMDIKDIINKRKIISGIKDVIKQVGIPTLLGIAGTGLIASLAKGPGYTAEFQGETIELLADTSDVSVLNTVAKAAPIILAIFLVRYGIKKATEIRDSQVIEEAKKFGLYDLIVQSMEAKKEYANYKIELAKEYGFDKEIGERIGTYGDGSHSR